MRVCVLANSHVYMLKMAADAHPPAWTPTFFGAPTRGLRALKRLPRGKGLHTSKEAVRQWMARTSGGLDRITYADYDAFVIVGLGLRTHDALALFSEFQTMEHHVTKEARLISEAAFRSVVRIHLEASTAWYLMRLLSGATDKPVKVIAAPFPHPAIVKQPTHAWITSPRASGAVAWVNKLVHDEYRQAAQALGYGFVTQPTETVGPDNLTLADFSRGAVNLGGRTYQDHDVSHMNTAFGKIMLDVIGRELGCAA